MTKQTQKEVMMKDMSLEGIKQRLEEIIPHPGGGLGPNTWGEGRYCYHGIYHGLLFLYEIAQHIDSLERGDPSYRADGLEKFIHEKINNCFRNNYAGFFEHQMSKKKKIKVNRICLASEKLYDKLNSRYEFTRVKKLDDLETNFYNKYPMLGNVEALCCMPKYVIDNIKSDSRIFFEARKTIRSNYTDEGSNLAEQSKYYSERI